VEDVGLGSSNVLGVIAPEDHLAVGREDLLQLETPVHLQLTVSLDVLQLHEVLDLGTQVPAGG
jgi:hypothetical protein